MLENKYYFNDHKRVIDYILVRKKTERKPEQVAQYLEDLKAEELELENGEVNRIRYVKVHVPQSVLDKYCDMLVIKLPVKNELSRIVYPEKSTDKEEGRTRNQFRCCKWNGQKREYQMMAEYLNSRKHLFDISEDLFPQTLRSMIAYVILNKVRYGKNDGEFGLDNVFKRKLLKTAFPLHDGYVNQQNTKRGYLLKNWGNFAKIGSTQPIDDVKDYYGLKIGLYFLWLGFYTCMLIPAAIMGIISMIFGAATLHADNFSYDVCNTDIIMCPQCDINCDFWNIKDSCTYTKITYFVDNDFTVVFAIFMSVWSATYMELWKRHLARRTHHWGLSGYELHNEIPRPEYLYEERKRGEINYWRHRLPWLVLSFAVALCIALLTLAAVFSIIIYRIALRASQALADSNSKLTPFIIPVTASILNLLAIYVLNIICEKVAYKLTKMEMQRTQTEFDDSLTLKIYLFQFVNFYSSIFYIAFFKGKLVGYPENYNRLFTFRQEECDPGGCLMELCIQLAIIMVGKQAITNVIEILIPYFKSLAAKCFNKVEDKTNYRSIVDKQVDEDLHLMGWNSRTLFPEYLEMVIQYGFVTLFVTAFPLAPLFALINNVVEIRIDAQKFLKYYRRPVAERVKNIGVWFRIIRSISIISVLTNALVIAFSSNFIPQLVYKAHVNDYFTEKGYLNFSLSIFDVADLDHMPKNSQYEGIKMCRYIGFRTPPSSDQKYTFTSIHFLILAAKLAFVVIYQNVVYLIILCVEWLVPDVPSVIKKQCLAENSLLKKKLIETHSYRTQFRTINK